MPCFAQQIVNILMMKSSKKMGILQTAAGIEMNAARAKENFIKNASKGFGMFVISVSTIMLLLFVVVVVVV